MTESTDLGALLVAQADDLGRLRALMQAQAAVLSMENVDLLDKLSREADEVLATINRRNIRIGHATPHLEAPLDEVSIEANSRVGRELAGAHRDALQLTARFGAEAISVANGLAQTERERSSLALGYGTGESLPGPVLVDRDG